MRLSAYPKFQAFDDDGNPLIGGKLYTYKQGTTTPKETYSDVAGATPNANPVVLDSRGEATVFASGLYKYVLKDSDDVTLWTLDNIRGSDFNDISYAGDDIEAAITAAGSTSTTILVDQATALTGNLTVPATVLLWVVPGGIITIPNTYRITINGQLTAGKYQIFNDENTDNDGVILTNTAEVWLEWFDATAGIDQNTFTKAIYATATGKTIKGSGAYTCTDKITVNKGIFVDFQGTLTFSKSNTPGIEITASNVKIEKGLTLVGPQFANFLLYENAIYCYAAVGSELTGIVIDSPTCHNWGGAGIYLGFAESHVYSPRVYNCGYAGVLNYCGFMAVIDPYVYDIIKGAGGTDSYGIVYTKGEGILTTYPKPTGYVLGGSVYNVEDWEGLDVHGGDGVKFIGVDVRHCKVGGTITSASADRSDDVSIDCGFEACSFDSEVTDGTYSNGIELIGKAAAYPLQRCFAINNVVNNYGGALGTNAGVHVDLCTNARVFGNHTERCNPQGYYFVRVNSPSVKNNKAVDPWQLTATNAWAYGFRFEDDCVDVDFDGNSALTNNLADATYTILKYGLYIANDAGNVRFMHGRNFYRGYVTQAIYDNRGGAGLLYSNWFDYPAGYGTLMATYTKEELLTVAAAATTDTAITIPAGAILRSVAVRVTTVIPTAATFTVIGAGSSTAFQTGASVSTAANTTNIGTAAGAYYNASAQAVRITPNTPPADNTGRIRVMISYDLPVAPTS